MKQVSTWLIQPLSKLSHFLGYFAESVSDARKLLIKMSTPFANYCPNIPTSTKEPLIKLLCKLTRETTCIFNFSFIRSRQGHFKQQIITAEAQS